MRALSLTGERFGRLLVIERDGSLHGNTAWRCRCDCGAEKTLPSGSLTTGLTKSCGCLRKEKSAANGRAALREVVQYRMAHQRVRIARGPACNHMCRCGQQADEWAYDHADPNELRSPEGLPYSLDVDRYTPMCRPCHRLFDLAQNRVGPREEAREGATA